MGGRVLVNWQLVRDYSWVCFKGWPARRSTRCMASHPPRIPSHPPHISLRPRDTSRIAAIIRAWLLDAIIRCSWIAYRRDRAVPGCCSDTASRHSCVMLSTFVAGKCSGRWRAVGNCSSQWRWCRNLRKEPVTRIFHPDKKALCLIQCCSLFLLAVLRKRRDWCTQASDSPDPIQTGCTTTAGLNVFQGIFLWQTI